MCSGRVDLEFILRAFLTGQDGVFIGGCRLGECNYVTHGNYHTQNMVLLCKRIMEHIGLNPERLRIEFMSGADGNILAEVSDDFARQIKAIGPLGQSEGLDKEALTAKLQDMIKLVPYIKIHKQEKLSRRIDAQQDADGFYTTEEIDQLLGQVISYYIDPERCRACMICSRKCPVEAIVGGKNLVHVIDQDKCIKCGTCFESCPPRFGAVTQIVGKPVPPSIPEGKRAIPKKRKAKS